jgi:hypothetical protein
MAAFMMPERSVFGVSKGDRSPWKEERTGPKWRPRKRQGDVTKRVGRNQPDFPTAERFSSTRSGRNVRRRAGVFCAMKRGPIPGVNIAVRHEVVDVTVLASSERTNSTCCSANSILPGFASLVTER